MPTKLVVVGTASAVALVAFVLLVQPDRDSEPVDTDLADVPGTVAPPIPKDDFPTSERVETPMSQESAQVEPDHDTIQQLIERYEELVADGRLGDDALREAEQILESLAALRPPAEALAAIMEAMSLHVERKSFTQVRDLVAEIVEELVHDHSELRVSVQDAFETADGESVARMLGMVLRHAPELFPEPASSYALAIRRTKHPTVLCELLGNVMNFQDDETTLELVDYALRHGEPENAAMGIITLYDGWRKTAGSYGAKELVLRNLHRDLLELARRPDTASRHLIAIEKILRECGFEEDADRVKARLR